jgi:hypothetical protein
MRRTTVVALVKCPRVWRHGEGLLPDPVRRCRTIFTAALGRTWACSRASYSRAERGLDVIVAV